MPALEQALVMQVLSDVNRSSHFFDTFIETGTFMGDTSHMASQIFNKVHTIEIFEPLYVQACQRFQNTNVEVHLGDTTQVLPTILPNATQNVVFWLDGHNSGPGTGVGQVDFPLLQECELIDKHFVGKEALILIDDVRLFGAGHPAQIDDSLLTLTVDKVLQTFTKRTIKQHQLYPSSIATIDRLALHIA